MDEWENLRNPVGGDKMALLRPLEEAGYSGAAMYVKEPGETCSWMFGAGLRTGVWEYLR